MADISVPPEGHGGGNGNGLAAPRRPPQPTGSPSGIRGPRMIMAERAAREARQKAEKAEAERARLERARAEQEARLEEEAQRRVAEQRAAAAAGVATGQDQTSGQRRPQYNEPQRPPHVAEAMQSIPAAPTTPQPTTHRRSNSAAYGQNQQIPSQVYSGQNQQQTSQPPLQQASVPPQTVEPPPLTGASGSSKPRNSFPHAFERWETLSAHWEGLTSYWIRKLEQNKEELNRDPVSSQLSRQVTDLSAAGANLFHAVVELQRLRASSERKFQRWFFETRRELEQAHELNTVLKNALEQERQGREEAVREALEKHEGSPRDRERVLEMKKELAISKDEARRAWEELGRREQIERDRTLSLQAGHPTIVGGVQVVPMTHGAPGRQTSARDPQQYQYASEHPPSGHASPDPASQQQQHQQQHQQQRQQPPQGGYSEGEFVTDVQGRPVYDDRGNRIPLAAPSSCSGSDAELEEYDTPATTNPPSGTYDSPASGPPGGGQQQQQQQQWSGNYSEPQDYSGQAYGAPSWSEPRDAPRHYHPTRLSDVIEEEDERSRTSGGQMSRG
ncbi:uncharacterized protein F5Z01DRAFT_202723 [Emericellopsis atlantica]|uniref:Uncharacterized protein n=1 Tax=Emericellopsis atlantica TaxID=2614577 RepID=A0A9P7ZVG9_9HYPO|nr:uncharacterized protein F5Z01DRAFT_202723 [Emericellopsis atlantica]KAG9258576.1 hypothetical protein F5Z01DRAFT_202723 [Emericellopsis atlantica]